jgi:hypothetical protein
MDGIIWLFLALLIVLMAVGVVVAVPRRAPGIDPKFHHCSRCQTPMSLRRVSLFQSLTLRRVWMCPHCGNRIKSGKGMPRTSSTAGG